MTAYLQQLFQTGLYKRTQGRHARQWTLIAVAVVVAAGAWALKSWLEAEGASTGAATLVPLGMLGAGLWGAFRLIQLPKFADFLIAVEAEMNKVSWPTRGELARAAAVVILVIFLLAAVLFLYDFVWKWVFTKLLG